MHKVVDLIDHLDQQENWDQNWHNMTHKCVRLATKRQCHHSHKKEDEMYRTYLWENINTIIYNTTANWLQRNVFEIYLPYLLSMKYTDNMVINGENDSQLGTCRIWSFHSDVSFDNGLPGCCAMWSSSCKQKFQRKMLHASPGLKWSSFIPEDGESMLL